MMHHVGAGVYLKEVFVSCCTKPLLLYYQNNCNHVTKNEKERSSIMNKYVFLKRVCDS